MDNRDDYNLDIHDPNYDWNNENRRKIRNQAAKDGIIVPIEADRNYRILNLDHHQYFTLLKHKSNLNETDQNVYSIIQCRACKKTLKVSWNGMDKTSYSTANINRHGCYEKIFKEKQQKEEEGKIIQQQKVQDIITKDMSSQCKNIISNDVASCIIKNIRPFSFTEGNGFQEVAASLIRVGTTLRTVPNDDVLKK